MEITATPPQGEICDGTGSQFSCFGVIYLCTKFHAFTTKCTINAAIRWTTGDAFSLMHHRYHSVVDVEHRREACWNKIVDAHSIKLYDTNGNKTGRLLYSENTVTVESTSTNPVSDSIATFTEAEASHDPETPATTTSVIETDVRSMEHAISEISTEDSETDEDNERCIDNTPAQDCINFVAEEPPHGEMKTSIGNLINCLLGLDEDLVRHDDLRFKLKETKKAGKRMHQKSISEYNALVAKFKPKIMLVESERAAELKQLEKQHFQQHGNLPTKTKGSQYSNLLKERNVAKAILRAM